MGKSHVCPACDTVQALGDGFCRECGTELVAVRYCDTCGVLAAHAGDFCSECGSRLAPLPPRNESGKSPDPTLPSSLATPEPPVPGWLTEPEPPPSNRTDRPARKRRKRRRAQDSRDPVPSTPAPPPEPRPLARRAPAPPPATAGGRSVSPLARARGGAPVPVRQERPGTGSKNAAGTAIGALGGAAGIGGLLLMGANPFLGTILVLTMFILAGRQSREVAARLTESAIDWVWEDPVLRKRLLGE